MPVRSTTTDWGSVTKLLHWLIALGIIGVAAFGWYMRGLPNSPDKIRLYALHKSAGITVLALVLIRIAWRLTEKHRPAPPPGIPRWQHVASVASHFLLYAAMLAMPLSGWLFNSAANFPLRWFGLFTLPALSGPNPELKLLAQDAHFLIFWVIAVLVTVHVAAALKHHFVDRDAVLNRMLPGRRNPAPALVVQPPAPLPPPPPDLTP